MITKFIAQNATHRQNFRHKTEKYSNGKEFLLCRVNGKCQTWKTRANDFKLPVKYGMFTHFYITPANAHEWEAIW